ncbi:hypothetical protein B566_EDAN002938 [Ephemera danica]|nr:hypothetical protein B566_EDAN002938 [Ephemera danica]
MAYKAGEGGVQYTRVLPSCCESAYLPPAIVNGSCRGEKLAPKLHAWLGSLASHCGRQMLWSSPNVSIAPGNRGLAARSPGVCCSCYSPSSGPGFWKIHPLTWTFSFVLNKLTVVCVCRPAEETFERSSHFYRGGSGSVAPGAETEASSGYLPRRGGNGAPAPAGSGPAYHAAAATSDGLRGRTRDRQQAVYRNGPTYPPSHLETGGRGAPATSHHRAGSGGGSAWNYDGVTGGVRYPAGGDPEEPPLAGTRQPAPCTPSSPATAAATSPSQAAPPAPAALLTLSSASASAARKSRHAKRRRGTARSSAAVTSGGVSDSEHSSGRGSRSTSRSSCSSSHSTNSSSSSCSSPSSSPGGSPGTRGQRASSRLLASMPPPSCGTGSHHNSSSSSGSGATHADDRRPLAICVRNLPARSSDTSLKDGLFHEYKKHGKVTWVKVVGSGSDRYALVCFKKPEDVDKALEVSHDKLFFGCKIDVAPYEGFDVDDNDFRPYEAELDEFHPKATRTLFIGNLEKDVTAAELRKHFEQFGEIIEIDIKKQGSVSSYAFCQYADIGAVVAAMRSMDGEHLGNNRIKLGFGKSMPTNCVWVDGVAESVSEKYLSSQFNQFGIVAQVSVDRARGHALVFFEQLSCAQAAVKELRGVTLQRRRLQLDFASRECQEAFYAHLEKQGCSPGTWERPPAATFDARLVAVEPQ